MLPLFFATNADFGVICHGKQNKPRSMKFIAFAAVACPAQCGWAFNNIIIPFWVVYHDP